MPGSFTFNTSEPLGKQLSLLRPDGSTESIVVGPGAGASVVLRPGDTSQAPNVFTSWASLYAACSAIQGGVDVLIDDSLQTPVHITAGSYNLNNWTLSGAASFADSIGSAAVVIDQGVIIQAPTSNVSLCLFSLDISSATTLDVCAVPPGVEVNLFMRDTHVVMTGTGALFNVSTQLPGGFLLLNMELFSLIGDGVHPVIKCPLISFVEVNVHTGSHTKAASVQSCNVSFDSSSENDLVAGAQLTVFQRDLASAMGYTPAVIANWSNVAPTSVANALDRIAAKITPIA